MKRLLAIICSLAFMGAIAQSPSHKHPHNPFPPLKNEAELLKGFDAKAAMREAMKKSSKPAEQQEWFETLKRRFLAQKFLGANKGGAAVGAGSNAKEGVGGSTPLPNNANCPNAGFDYGDYSNWVGGTYTNSTSQLWNTFTPAWTPGIMTSGVNTLPQAVWPGWAANPYPNRMTLMTIPPTLNTPPNCIGWDSIAVSATTNVSEIEFVPPTANGVTCRLGNANNNWNETERLVYSMFVTPQNSQFTYAYAVIIYDGGHLTGEQPFFKISFKDQNGTPIPGCGQYQIDATMVATDTSFHQAAGGWGIYYKKWTSVGMNLNAYIGQTITMEFQTGDCTYGGHWCYAYIDAPGGGCSPAQATVNMCSGSTTATLVAPYGYSSYQWYGPNGMVQIPGATNDSLLITNAVVGDVYTVSVISAAGCTTQMQTTLINTNIQIQSTYSSPSCQTGFSGSATVVPIGSNNGYNYTWTNVSNGASVGGNAATATGLAPGTYSVVVSSPGCGMADTVVTVGVTAPVFYTDVQNFCLSPANITAPSGSNYVWYDPSGNLIPGATSGTLPVPNPVNGTSYTTVFNNPSGCKDSVKITLDQTVNTQTVNATFCGTSANLCAPVGSTNVIWYDANWPYSQIGTGTCINIPNPIASPWQPYYYSYTNGTTGCLDSVMIYLTNTPASVYASNILPTCLNDSTGSATININSGTATSFTLTVTGPVNYSNNTAGATTNLTNLPAGTYNVTFTDPQCSASTTFMIDTVFVNVTTSYLPDSICSGQASTVTFNYGGGTPSMCNTTSQGCGSSMTQTVGTGMLQNTSTTWPAVYGNWYSNEKYQILYTAADLNAAGITAGKISAIAFDVASIPAGMNQTFINYTIKIACTGVSDLDPSNLGWNIPFVTPVTTVVWGPQNYTCTNGWNTHTFTQAYEWDGTSNIIVEICYDWVSSGSYTYNAVMNSSNTAYRSFMVYNSDSSPACPQTTANSSYTQRPNTQFTTCQSVSLPSDFTYTWSPNTGVSGTPPTVSLTPTVTITYSVTITSNFGGCSKVDTFPITVVNPFTVSMPASNIYCVASPVDTFSASVVPGPGTGIWSGPGITDAGNGADAYFDPSVAGLGTHTITYTASSAGCTVIGDTTMTVISSADATIAAAGPFCITDADVNLSVVNPGGTFSGNGVTNTTTGVFSPSTAGAGTHAVSYIFGGGCADTGSVSITVYPQPVIAISSDTASGCNPATISFLSTVPAPANGNAQWFFGDGFTGNTQSMSHIYADTGSYTVTFIYTDANGCSDTLVNQDMITVYPSVTAAFTASPPQTTIIAPLVSFTNQSINADTYFWQITEDSTSTLQDPTFTFIDVGTYNVMLAATNQYGCTDTVYNSVVIDPDVALYVPNGFTPGDENGLNDEFIPYISGIDMTTYRMEIYDRWGSPLFTTVDVNEGWNGRKNNAGEIVPNGVYVFKIYYKDENNKKVTHVGHISVIK